MSMFSGITIALREDNGFELNMADVHMEFSESFQVLNSTAVEFDQWCTALDRLEQLNRSIEQHDGRADKSLITFLNQNNDLAEVLGVDLSLENWDDEAKGAEIQQGYSMAMEGVWESIKNFFINIWEGIKNFFKNFFNMFKSTKANFEAVKNDPKAVEKIANAPAPANPSSNAAVVDLAKKLGVEVKMLPAPKEAQPPQPPAAQQNNQPPASDGQKDPQKNVQAPANDEPRVIGAVAIKASAFQRVFTGAKTCYEGIKSFAAECASSGPLNQGNNAFDAIAVFEKTMKQPLAQIDIQLVRSNDGKKLVIGGGDLAFNKDELVTEGKSYGDILAKAGWAGGGGIDVAIQCANDVPTYEKQLKELEQGINRLIGIAEKDETSKAPNSAGAIEDQAFRAAKVDALKNIGKCVARITAIVGQAGKFLDQYGKELRGIVEKYQQIG